jgi:hypothetical protein
MEVAAARERHLRIFFATSRGLVARKRSSKLGTRQPGRGKLESRVRWAVRPKDGSTREHTRRSGSGNL